MSDIALAIVLSTIIVVSCTGEEEKPLHRVKNYSNGFFVVRGFFVLPDYLVPSCENKTAVFKKLKFGDNEEFFLTAECNDSNN